MRQRSRVATCTGNLPLSHPMVRQLRSSAKGHWSSAEQTESLALLVEPLRRRTTNHAP
jgi:hypothetical protein